MREENLLETRELGDYRIKVFADYNDECPCIGWDMVGCFLWDYSRCQGLSNDCNWRELYNNNRGYDVVDALKTLMYDYVEYEDLIQYISDNKLSDFRMRYDEEEDWYYIDTWCGSDGWKWTVGMDAEGLKDSDNMEDIVRCFSGDDLLQILQDLGKNIFIKEWSSAGCCQGDYLEGVVFCDIERYKKMVSEDTTDWEDKVEKYINNDIKTLRMWHQGDVKGFVVEQKIHYTKHYTDPEREDEECFEWEEIDSCWGNYMETEELIEMAISENHLK